MYAVSAGGGYKLPKDTVTNQVPNANSIVSGITQSINDAYRSIGNKQTQNNIAYAQANAIKNAINKNGDGGSGSKSGGSGKGSGGSSGGQQIDLGGYDGIDYEAIYRAQMEAARAAADRAYERNMARIADAYNSASGNLRSNYDSTVGRLKEARNNSLNDVNSDAEKSLREAYINNMLTKRNLNQRLSAMGYNGGATETTMANLENQYGNSRTGINEVLNKNITNLNSTYGDNLAAALQQYNTGMSNLDLQRMQLENAAENARNNLEASYMNSPNITMDSNYVNALRNIIAKQTAYNYNPTAATNDFIAGNVRQADATGQSTNYAKLLAQARLAAEQGNSRSSIQNDIYEAMLRNDITAQEGFNILSNLSAR